MAEYASKGVAGTALGLGIAGTVGLVNQMTNGCNGGLLGGIFGGNNYCVGRAAGAAELQFVSSLQAENAMLKSENYSDKSILEAYKQSVADNKELRSEMYAFIKPLADEAANNRVTIARLEEQQKCCCEKQELREQIMHEKIDKVALMANNGITALAGTVAYIQNIVNGITEVSVPINKVCPQPMPQYNSWTAPTATAPTNVTLTNPVTVQG